MKISLLVIDILWKLERKILLKSLKTSSIKSQKICVNTKGNSEEIIIRINKAVNNNN